MPGNPLQTVTSVGNLAANSAGGWCVGATVSDPAGTLSLFYGATFGMPPTTLVTEGLYGSLQQTSFESFFGFGNAGEVSYSPSTDDVLSGATGLDGCWVNTTVIANEDDPILSLPGKVFRFNSRPNILGTGEPVWIGGINDISGATEGNALFRGASQSVVVMENDVLPGMPFPLSSGSAVDFDFRFSPSGNHHILAVDLASPSFNDDLYVDYDGAALLIGGLIVGEGQPMPPALQVAPGENWDNFDSFGISDDGSYLFTGDTDGPTATDEFVVIDGAVALREGDLVGGLPLSGSIESGALSAREDWGVVWDVDDPLLGNVEALIFNGRLLMKEGDTISTDLTGDGIPEVGAITNFTGLANLSIGIDRAAYFSMDLDYLGTSTTSDDVEVAMRFEVPDLLASADGISASAGGSLDLTLFAPPELGPSLYLLLGSASGTTPGLVVDGLVLPLNVDSYFLSTLTSPNAPPLAGSFGFLDASSTAAAQLTIPPGAATALVGLTLHHAYATIDALAGVVTYTSSAVATTILP